MNMHMKYCHLIKASKQNQPQVSKDMIKKLFYDKISKKIEMLI